jgi:hypothetical protein
MSSKIREALSKASVALSWAAHSHLTEDDAKEYLEIVESALNEPLRNYDVGTATEQRKRFHKEYFSKHTKCKRHRWSLAEGALEWAQMPYESEVK